MTNSWLLGRGVPVHIPLPFNVQLLQRPAMVMPMRMVGSCEKSLCGFESLCNSVLNQVTHTITFQKSFTTTETEGENGKCPSKGRMDILLLVNVAPDFSVL